MALRISVYHTRKEFGLVTKRDVDVVSDRSMSNKVEEEAYLVDEGNKANQQTHNNVSIGGTKSGTSPYWTVIDANNKLTTKC